MTCHLTLQGSKEHLANVRGQSLAGNSSATSSVNPSKSSFPLVLPVENCDVEMCVTGQNLRVPLEFLCLGQNTCSEYMLLSLDLLGWGEQAGLRGWGMRTRLH
jgi:hypothetical protein